MKPYLVVYATRDGHTFRIADHIADALREQKIEVRTHNAASWEAGDLRAYSGVLLAAPVHAGVHASEMIRFVRSHCADLLELSARMLSVSLYQGGIDRLHWEGDRRERAERKVRQYAATFSAATGFPQSRIIPLGGALVYSRYGLIKRFLVRQVARRIGAGCDTTRDYDYTNWQRVDQLLAELAHDPRITAQAVSEPFSFNDLDPSPSSARGDHPYQAS